MEIPQVKVGGIIKIGNHFNAPKAQIVYIYSEGEVEVVYWQNKLKGIKEDVVWSGTEWKFKYDGPNGSYVNIDEYDPRLKI